VVKQGTSPDSRQKEKIPHDKWAINKAQSYAQAKIDDQSVAGTTTTNQSTQIVEKKDGHTGWAGIHCSFAQGFALKELILLDSDSKDTIFCNPKYPIKSVTSWTLERPGSTRTQSRTSSVLRT